MIYLIFTFGVVIIFALAFIVWAFRHYADINYEGKQFAFLKKPIPVIERAYRGVDLYSSVSYISREFAMRYGHSFNSNNQIINDAEHKKYLLRKICSSLTEEMMDKGFFEILDTQGDRSYTHHPDQNILSVRVKVYKPEL